MLINHRFKSPDNNGLHTEPRVARVLMFSEFAAARRTRTLSGLTNENSTRQNCCCKTAGCLEGGLPWRDANYNVDFVVPAFVVVVWYAGAVVHDCKSGGDFGDTGIFRHVVTTQRQKIHELVRADICWAHDCLIVACLVSACWGT